LRATVVVLVPASCCLTDHRSAKLRDVVGRTSQLGPSAFDGGVHAVDSAAQLLSSGREPLVLVQSTSPRGVGSRCVLTRPLKLRTAG
jgi:hypothetical protein